MDALKIEKATLAGFVGVRGPRHIAALGGALQGLVSVSGT